MVPKQGSERRNILRLAAISTTIYEQSTAHYFESQRPTGSIQSELLERYRLQTTGGLKYLDSASELIDTNPFNSATISAVIALEYVQLVYPELKAKLIAPSLSAIALKLSAQPCFEKTRPL